MWQEQGYNTTIAVVLRANHLSILLKVEKLICHEVSARKLGSIAEADAFAAKARQLLLQHRQERVGNTPVPQPSPENAKRVTAQEAGITALKTRQEWSERLAAGIAEAFHCNLMLQAGSNTVIFRGRESDRAAAAQLYAELAQKAAAACSQEFTEWKQHRRRSHQAPRMLRTDGNAAAYSRRWKQSFLLGFARTICQRFVCDHNCLDTCKHASGLVRIGIKTDCTAKTVQGRPIGGIDLLYDAVYRGQAHAVAVVLDLDRRAAA